MKQIEYFYNVIYYFFYRAAIKFAKGSIYIGMPILKVFYFFVNRIPSIRKYYVTEENDDPLDAALKRTKKFTENPTLGIGTIIGAGLAQNNFLLFYIGMYHIIKHFLFPTFEDKFIYIIVITVILAFLTDVVFAQINDKSIKYIKEFNKKKGWWRTKWKIITILSPFVSLAFCLYSAWYIDV